MRVAAVNAAIARLTYMTSGEIGRDWQSGCRFVLYWKGDEWDALKQATEALRVARAEIERLEAR